MTAAASRTSFSGLLKRGWDEIPEVIGSSGLGIVGLILAGVGCYNYEKRNGDNRKYKHTYVIMRPDDPRAKFVHKD